MKSFPLRLCCVLCFCSGAMQSESDSTIVARLPVNEWTFGWTLGWIACCRLSYRRYRFTSLHLLYPASMTYDVSSKPNISPAFECVCLIESFCRVQNSERITLARQSLIERCVRQTYSVIAALPNYIFLTIYLIESRKCICISKIFKHKRICPLICAFYRMRTSTFCIGCDFCHSDWKI